MALYLGIDTSNYTTSAALYDSKKNSVAQEKQLLPVREGALGLRQSDAVFAHVKQLGAIMEKVMAEAGEPLAGVGVSVRPRDVEGSYMPCFLTGEMAARSVASVLRIPVVRLSHQAGHIAAALYSSGKLALIGTPFVAFHLSGGTTECLLVRPGQNTFDVELFAKSLDLKAGQLIDRVGGMLGLPFPAGKGLEALSGQCGEQYRVRPVLRGNDCCLSGFENLCAKMCRDGEPPENVARFCLSAVRETVVEMTRRVKAVYNWPVVYAGGVMSNRMIQNAVKAGFDGFVAEPAFSSDNAAGAAILASRTLEGAQ